MFKSRLHSEKLLRNVRDMKVYSNNWQPNCDRVLPMYDVLLSSYGGSGSTSGFMYLESAYGLRVNHEGDLDGLKHLSFWDLSIKLEKCKVAVGMVIYQFDDPTNSIYSLFRRKFSSSQVKKLGVPYSPTHCSDPKLFTDVDKYASTNRDLFGFGRHIESYLVGGSWSSKVPIVFLKSSDRFRSDVRVSLERLWRKYRIPYVRNESWNPAQGNTGYFYHNTSTDRYSNLKSYNSLRHTYAGLENLQRELGSLTLVHRGIIMRVI